VKPSREDASHGIAIESVVSGERAVRARAKYVIDTYAQPALVEEFVEGREFNVSLLEEPAGPRVLPLAEIDFTTFPKGAPRVVSYEAKWRTGSPEHRGTPSIPRGSSGAASNARSGTRRSEPGARSRSAATAASTCGSPRMGRRRSST
jgi:hypothetical protein